MLILFCDHIERLTRPWIANTGEARPWTLEMRQPPTANRHYHPVLLQSSFVLRKDSGKSRWNRYAHQQAAILKNFVIDSFGGGTR
jgi:hypothetical protein